MSGCAVCGRPDAHRSVGGVVLCNEHYPVLLERLEAARVAGQPADATKEARALLRETAQDYILRDIPADLWRSAKIAAAERGVSLRDLLLDSLRGVL